MSLHEEKQINHSWAFMKHMSTKHSTWERYNEVLELKRLPQILEIYTIDCPQAVLIALQVLDSTTLVGTIRNCLFFKLEMNSLKKLTSIVVAL